MYSIDTTGNCEAIKEYLYFAVEHTSDWVIITNKQGIIEYANSAVEEISGFKKEEILGKTPSVFKSGLYSKDDYRELWNTILSGRVYKKILINKKKNGDFFQINHTIIPVLKDGEVIKFVSIAKDLSKELALEQEIKKFRYEDPLTGLLNRNGFVKEVEKAIKAYGDIELNKAILVIDISGFSHLNEVYGIEICDNLLKDYGKRLSNIIEKKSILARINGDVFAIFTTYQDTSKILQKINKILSLFEVPFLIENSISVKLTCKIGIRVLEKSEESITDALQKAELALNLVKKEQERIFRFYNDELNKKVTEYVEIFNLIKECIDNRWFTFHFQPIYNTQTLKVISLEALIRIQHPTKGIIYPGSFINIIENSNLLKDFEIILFELALEYLNKIHSISENFKYNLAINVSVNSFKNKSILELAKLVPENLIEFINIEITERVFAENNEKIINTLNDLKQIGFTLEIDDFGTGYSSLGYIDRVPADYLKIDMSFVWKMNSCKKTYSIVKTIITLAKELGIKTIAEGVETEDQFNSLKELGCDFVQGYYFCKPLPYDGLIEKLKSLN